MQHSIYIVNLSCNPHIFSINLAVCVIIVPNLNTQKNIRDFKM